MGMVIEFPSRPDRKWSEVLGLLRDAFEDLTPDGGATLITCLPAMRTHWERIFQGFSIDLEHHLPQGLSEADAEVIRVALNRSAEAVAAKLDAERTENFFELCRLEFLREHERTNGT